MERLKPSEYLRKSKRRQAYGAFFAIQKDNKFNYYPVHNIQENQENLCTCSLGAIYEQACGLPEEFLFSFSCISWVIKQEFPELENQIGQENSKKIKQYFLDKNIYTIAQFNQDDFYSKSTIFNVITILNDELKLSFNHIANILEIIGL